MQLNRSALLACAAFLLTSDLCFAQSFYAGLRGRVTDASGGAVAGASLTLLNPTTGISVRTVANDQGEYVLQAVNPGAYDLYVESAGMK